MLEAVRALDGAGIEPATMVLREPTLDDVFLTLTGAGAGTDNNHGIDGASA
jgi:hypothetical protein